MKIFIKILLLFVFIYPNISNAYKLQVIAIDIGHTPQKPGATSARGVKEFYFNKKIAKLVKANLLKRGFRNAFIINPKGENISLLSRTAIAKQKKASLFVSIHHDSMQRRFLNKWKYKGKTLLHSEAFKGFSLFISRKKPTYKNNLRIANLIGSNMLKRGIQPSLHHAMRIKGENRTLINKGKGIYNFPSLAVLRTAKMPAILVECGIILNKDEERLLSSNKYQRKIAKAISDSIEQFFH